MAWLAQMHSKLAIPKFSPVHYNGTSHPTLLSWLTTIRARVCMAFGFAAAITLIGSLIALHQFSSIGETTTRIVTYSMPAMVQSLRLAEETSGLVASAPRLMAVVDERGRTAVAGEIAEQTRNLAARIERLRILDGSRGTEIETAQTAMVQRLDALSRAVTERLIISDQRRAMALSVRKAHEELLEGINPLIDDANFDLMIASKTTGQKASGELIESLRHLLEVQAEGNLLAGLLAEASLVTEKERLHPLRDLIDAARRKIETNLGALANSERKEKLTRLYEKLAAITGRTGVIALRSRELNAQQEAEVAYTATQAEALKLKQAVDRLVEQQGEGAETIATRAHEQIRSGRILLVTLSIAALVLALVSGYYVLQAISRPLGQLSAAMDVVRQGDFTERMDVGRRDEFGDLAEGFNRMADEVTALVGQVQKSGIQVGSAVTEIAATAKQQQATVSEIAATTTQIGATSREISATSKELAKTMNEVSAVADQTAALASGGQAGLTRMEKIMPQVMEAARSINGKLAVLNEKAGNINQVVTTITKVADQTNLLSLNAAIEAEKAGEYGRGFAVVASEIRRLADQTAIATFDIELIVKEIQSAISAGVMGMDKFSEEVRHGMQDVQQVGSQLSQIIEQVQALVPRVEAVNEGMQAQATGAEQISEALLQLTQAAQQTAESLQQSTSAIDALNQVSGNLHNSVLKLAA
jgi:methyl-accepting chemotaxis protein WspA